MAKNWFENEFLNSLDKRMNNPKYPNSCLLTDKQADVCMNYMKEKECVDIKYGTKFLVYEYETKKASYQLCFHGKYNFLYRYPYWQGLDNNHVYTCYFSNEKDDNIKRYKKIKKEEVLKLVEKYGLVLDEEFNKENPKETCQFYEKEDENNKWTLLVKEDRSCR